MLGMANTKRLCWKPVLLAAGMIAFGCYAEATPGVATVEYAPAHVERYPYEYYDGHYVYLVGDRWYYQDGPHWVYYTREPEVLVHRRVVIHQAPPVRHGAPDVREESRVHRAPPDRGRYEPAREREYRY